MHEETVECRNFRGEDPAEWVCEYAPLIPRQGRVLDLACGRGRHARWLAGQGYRVLAVDRDAEALAGLSGSTGIETVCADLEQAAWPLGSEAFAGIVVTRYLHRPLLPVLVGALQTGGVLIYETFMRGNEAWGRPSRPEFLLEPGELRRVAAEFDLEVVASREGFVALPRPAVLQSICARRFA